jgi:hypothetical protein
LHLQASWCTPPLDLPLLVPYDPDGPKTLRIVPLVTYGETDFEVCSSDMCMAILECLLEFDGMGFCCDLMGQPSPSPPAPSNDAGGTCVTVHLLSIAVF